MDRLPSTDLYFTNALAPRPTRWWQRGPAPHLHITRHGANCFSAGRWLILIRRDSEAVMRKALAWPGPLAYVIDDDIAGAATSPGLPSDYRQRLARFDQTFHRPLLTRAQVLLVPSEALASRFAAETAITAAIHRIEPCWHLPPADQAHFAALADGGPLRLVHLGTASHAGALVAMAPALADLLCRHENLHFTYVAREPLAMLPRHNTQHIAPRRWPRYRRWLGRQRFHLALYPLLPTPFDRARSAAKLAEHAIAGAVGLYPQNWAPAQILGAGALYAPADPADWAQALEQAIVQRRNLAPMAARAAATLACQSPCAVQQRLWRHILTMDK